MKLIKCYVENFGTLSEYRHDFTDGVNCILENNSWGKSTLAAFIKAMLYGLPATRASDLSKNERKKYMPWSKGAFGGYLCIEHDGREYRIERSFAKNSKDDILKVTELASGKETDIFGEVPGQTLFGVNASAFERSVFVSKESPKDEKDEGLKSIVAKLSGIVDKSDIENYNSAIKTLDDRRKLYSVTKGGLIGEQKSILLDLQGELEESLEKLAYLGDVNEQIEGADEELNEISMLKLKLSSEISKMSDRALVEEKRENYKKLLKKEREYKQRISSLERELGEISSDGSLFQRLEEDVNKYEWCGRVIADSQGPLSLSKRDTAQLFSKYLPDIALISELESKKAELDGKKKNNALFLTNEERERLERLEKMSFPTDSEKNEYERETHRIEFLNEERAKCNNEIAKDQGTAFDGRSMALSLVFSLFCITGVLLALFWNVIAGVAVSLVSVILLVLTFVKGSKTQKSRAAGEEDRLAQINKSIAELENQRKKFADKYGINVYDTYALKYLDDRQAELQRLREKRENSRKAFEEFESEMCDFEQRMNDIYEKMGHPELANGDFSRFCIKVRSFTENKEEYLAEKARFEGAVSDKKMLRIRLDGFFAAVGITEYGSYKEALQNLRDRMSELSHIRNDLEGITLERKKYLADNPECEVDFEETNRVSEYDPQKELDDLIEREKVIIAEKAIYEAQRAKIEEKVHKIPEIQEEIENHRQILKEYEYRLSVIEKTKEVLSTAKDNLSKRYHGAMKERFESCLSELSGDKVIVGEPDSDLNVHIESHGMMRDIEYFSTGIRELVFVALHIALVDVLFDREGCFIILDDPFVSLDGEHLKKSKIMLKKLGQTRQIIYFTCHESRALTGGDENE